MTGALLEPHGLKLGDVAALLHANLFKPVLMMKERQAGFSADQLYLDNIPRLGHCFAADPLINLVDRAARGDIGPGGYGLLAASVPGSRIGALLRRIVARRMAMAVSPAAAFELPDTIAALPRRPFEFSPAAMDEADAIVAGPPEALFRRLLPTRSPRRRCWPPAACSTPSCPSRG